MVAVHEQRLKRRNFIPTCGSNTKHNSQPAFECPVCSDIQRVNVIKLAVCPLEIVRAKMKLWPP